MSKPKFPKENLEKAKIRMLLGNGSSMHKRRLLQAVLVATVAVMMANRFVTAQPTSYPNEAGNVKPALSASDIPTSFINSIGMKFVRILPGTFTMGSPVSEKGRYDEDGPQHKVTIAKPFYMSAYETPQKQFKEVMGKNPSTYPGDNRPVETITWEDAAEFCRKLSEREDKVYRLPTEAEWEYSCRAGSDAPYCFGADEYKLSEYAHYNAWLGENLAYFKSLWGTKAVGHKKPNSWGLYDMHGNVLEYCSDWYGWYEAGAQVDPTGPDIGRRRVDRGGCWSVGARDCRSAKRGDFPPSVAVPGLRGFRVVCELSERPHETDQTPPTGSGGHPVK